MAVAASMDDRLNDLVTSHMRVDFARLRADQTVGNALAYVRQHPPEGRIIYFYVVDDEGRLQGVVPTRRLLLSPDDAAVSTIMVREVIAIPERATVLEACEFFTLHRLLAFPVVGREGRLMGIVDVELYTEELTDIEKREGNDEVFQLIGLHLAALHAVTPLAAFRLRFPWLLANIAGGILAAFLTGVFEQVIAEVVALALFIPVVLALAESVSIQSVSLSLESLRGRTLGFREFVRNMQGEVATGFFLGIAGGALVGGVAFVWLGEWGIVGCLLGGIGGGVTCAAVIGKTMPHLIRLVGREPQVAAGPLALATTDMATLVIYFSLARWIFG